MDRGQCRGGSSWRGRIRPGSRALGNRPAGPRGRPGRARERALRVGRRREHGGCTGVDPLRAPADRGRPADQRRADRRRAEEDLAYGAITQPCIAGAAASWSAEINAGRERDARRAQRHERERPELEGRSSAAPARCRIASTPPVEMRAANSCSQSTTTSDARFDCDRQRHDRGLQARPNALRATSSGRAPSPGRRIPDSTRAGGGARSRAPPSLVALRLDGVPARPQEPARSRRTHARKHRTPTSARRPHRPPRRATTAAPCPHAPAGHAACAPIGPWRAAAPSPADPGSGTVRSCASREPAAARAGLSTPPADQRAFPAAESARRSAACLRNSAISLAERFFARTEHAAYAARGCWLAMIGALCGPLARPGSCWLSGRGPAARKSSASPPPVAASRRERAVYGDHRRAAGVDGVDDLGVVDALEIDRGDAEVGVAELALDDDQRHALAGHLDGVGVP